MDSTYQKTTEQPVDDGSCLNYLSHHKYKCDVYAQNHNACDACDRHVSKDYSISHKKVLEILDKYFTRLYYDHAEALIEEIEELPPAE